MDTKEMQKLVKEAGEALGGVEWVETKANAPLRTWMGSNKGWLFTVIIAEDQVDAAGMKGATIMRLPPILANRARQLIEGKEKKSG